MALREIGSQAARLHQDRPLEIASSENRVVQVGLGEIGGRQIGPGQRDTFEEDLLEPGLSEVCAPRNPLLHEGLQFSHVRDRLLHAPANPTAPVEDLEGVLRNLGRIGAREYPPEGLTNPIPLVEERKEVDHLSIDSPRLHDRSKVDFTLFGDDPLEELVGEEVLHEGAVDKGELARIVALEKGGDLHLPGHVPGFFVAELHYLIFHQPLDKGDQLLIMKGALFAVPEAPGELEHQTELCLLVEKPPLPLLPLYPKARIYVVQIGGVDGLPLFEPGERFHDHVQEQGAVGQVLEVVDPPDLFPILFRAGGPGPAQIGPDLLVVELLEVDHLGARLLPELLVELGLDLGEARSLTDQPGLFVPILEIVGPAGEQDLPVPLGGASQFMEVAPGHLPAHPVRHLVEGIEEENDLTGADQVDEARKTHVPDAAGGEVAHDDALEGERLSDLLEGDEYGRGMAQGVLFEPPGDVECQEAGQGALAGAEIA